MRLQCGFSLYRARNRVSVGSISNMLINDPFERWIDGVGFVHILFRRRRPTFECQKERARLRSLDLSPCRSIKITHRHITSYIPVSSQTFGRNKTRWITQIFAMQNSSNFMWDDRIATHCFHHILCWITSYNCHKNFNLYNFYILILIKNKIFYWLLK